MNLAWGNFQKPRNSSVQYQSNSNQHQMTRKLTRKLNKSISFMAKRPKGKLYIYLNSVLDKIAWIKYLINLTYKIESKAKAYLSLTDRLAVSQSMGKYFFSKSSKIEYGPITGTISNNDARVEVNYLHKSLAKSQ